VKKFLFFFALTGWTISLVVHFAALFADYDATRDFPFIWLLHIGIFIVWLAAVILLKKSDLSQFRNSNPFDFAKQKLLVKTIFRNSPAWLTTIAVIGFFYAMINFMLFILSQQGTPDIVHGQYILQNHGQVIKTITEAEYNHYAANQTRGFSGHWILFYGLAMAILFPYGNSEPKPEI
jgi:hypothetical protein